MGHRLRSILGDRVDQEHVEGTGRLLMSEKCIDGPWSLLLVFELLGLVITGTFSGEKAEPRW